MVVEAAEELPEAAALPVVLPVALPLVCVLAEAPLPVIEPVLAADAEDAAEPLAWLAADEALAALADAEADEALADPWPLADATPLPALAEGAAEPEPCREPEAAEGAEAALACDPLATLCDGWLPLPELAEEPLWLAWLEELLELLPEALLSGQQAKA